MIGEEIKKKLGFGLMRLPQKDGKSDLEQTADMVDLFLGAGFNYFDTARAYGDSEQTIRKALVERYPRDKFVFATKNAAWIGAKNADEAKAMFETSLENTGLEYIDYYLAHNIGDFRTKVFDDFDLWDFFKGLKESGSIRHLGFSFHDKVDVLEGFLDKHPEMEFVQLQINYADWENDMVDAKKNYELVKSRGLPIVIMEPVKGGMLVNIPEQVEKIFKEINPGASSASWGIRFAASLEGVMTVLSGMSSIEQMKDNISFMKDFTPLNKEEQTAIVKARAIIDSLPRIPCTSCRYCMKGCPQNINIPGIFSAKNYELMYDNKKMAKGHYGFATWTGAKASDCIGCGQCETVCPQHINIIDELKKCADDYE